MNHLPKVLCPFCSAPWSEKTLTIWDVDGADQCEEGRFGPPTYSITIKCLACKRKIYREEDAEARYGESG